MRYVLYGLGAIVLIVAIYLLTLAPKTEFNFANTGYASNVICIVQKDWGLFGQSKINCGTWTPFGIKQDEIRYKCSTLNGEIVLTTK